MSQDTNTPAYLWGLAKDGTNLWWDIFFSFLATYFVVLVLDTLIPDALQESAWTLTTTVIIAAGVLTWLAAWDRMRKDNRNRKAVSQMTPQQKAAMLQAVK